MTEILEAIDDLLLFLDEAQLDHVLRKPVVFSHVDVDSLTYQVDYETAYHSAEEVNETPINIMEESMRYDVTRWAHAFPNRGYVTIPLSRDSIASIMEAADDLVCRPTNKVFCKTRTISDETWKVLEPLVEKIESQAVGGPYFIKLDSISPKDSSVGVGPHSSGQNMITALASSARCIKNMMSCKQGTNLILVPWQTMDPTDEFRCFIYKNELTAISVYSHLDEKSKKWSDQQVQLTRVAKLIQSKWNELAPDLPWDTAVMDVHVNPFYQIVEVVEFNPFGAQLHTGSSLFHWVRDYDQLYGRTPHLEVRLMKR